MSSRISPKSVGVLGGGGARYLVDELKRGAHGAMPAVELTDLHVAIWDAWRAGDEARARSLYTLSLPLLIQQAVFRMRLTKEVLRLRGVLAHTGVRDPLPELDDGDRAEIATLVAALDDALATEPVS